MTGKTRKEHGEKKCQEVFQGPKAAENKLSHLVLSTEVVVTSRMGGVWITACRSSQVNSEKMEGNSEMKGEAK